MPDEKQQASEQQQQLECESAGELAGPGAGSGNPHQALFDSIPQSGFKCDIIFLVIKNRIREEPEYVRRLRVVFQFNISKESSSELAVWTCDTRSSLEGDVYREPPRGGLKPDCVLSVDDDDWVRIMVGKLNPQRAFMMSKFRVKGNIMLLQKLHALWFDLRRKGKTPEIDLVQEIIVDQPLVAGLKAEAMAIELVQRIVKSPHLVAQIDARLQVDVLRHGHLIISYGLSLRPGARPDFRRHIYGAGSKEQQAPPTGADVTLVLEDDELVLLIYGLRRIEESLRSGRLVVRGSREVLDRARPLFEQPAILARL